MLRACPYNLLSLLVCVLLPAHSLAWGGDGHQIVCLIAEQGVTKEADAMIHDLLGKDVDISDAELANWADEHRREARKTAPWHYVNIPIDSNGYDPKRDGNKGSNVIDKAIEFERVLSDKSKPKEERAEALKYLVHLVGDLHQPLHSGDRGDRGGNSRLVFFLYLQTAQALHKVWDSTILRKRKARTPIADYADRLLARISKQDAEAWAKGTPIDWANESVKVSRDVVYAGVPGDGPPPKLDQKYVDRAGEAIDLQLEKAGVRLASILNQIVK